MGITIKDVAKMANVSISTVSRVINHAPNVNEQIRENVLNAIKTLNYKPNVIAQSLSGSPFKAVGIAASRSSNAEYTSQVLSSIGEYMGGKKYHVILNYQKNTKNELDECLSMINGSIVQGIILLGSKQEDVLVSKLVEMHVPLVVIGRVSNPELSKKVCQVDTDHIISCQKAVSYLFSLGHKKIACIHSSTSYVATFDRINGYLLAHKEQGSLIDPSYIVDGGFSFQEAYNVAHDLLTRSDRPTAIFTTDDTKALACYKVASDLGLNIPDDLSIIGCNDYDTMQYVTPALTTIHVPINELGIESARLLMEQIDKSIEPCRKILETHIEYRESCKPPKIQN